MKVLIDTPIWSKFVRRKKQYEKNKLIINELTDLINDKREVIIGPIRQELLSGISDKQVFDDLKEKMTGFIDFFIRTSDYELAAEYHNICRTHGIQGSLTDFILCAVAVRNDWEIFTEDNDFLNYKKYLPIKLYTIKTKK